MGVTWIVVNSFLMAGLYHNLQSSLAPSAKVSWGKNSARMTKTSLKGIGLNRSRVTSVSHCSHAFGSLLPTRKLHKMQGLCLRHWGDPLLAHNYATTLAGGSEVPAAQKQCANLADYCFRADPERQSKWRRHSISDEYDFRVAKFELGEEPPTFRQAAVQRR